MAVNRGEESCVESRSSIVRTSTIGMVESIEETRWLTADSRLSGSTAVRTTVRRQHQTEIWLAGKYITGFISR